MQTNQTHFTTKICSKILRHPIHPPLSHEKSFLELQWTLSGNLKEIQDIFVNKCLLETLNEETHLDESQNDTSTNVLQD